MSSFAAWGLAVLGLAVITTVAEMLLPSGKTRNCIRSVAATLAVLVMVMPLPSLIDNGFSFDFYGAAVETDGAYIAATEQLKCDIAQNAVREYLKQKGLNGDYSVKVYMQGYAVKSVTVDFSEFGITQKPEHINKSEIIKSIADYFGIDEEAVMSYG